VFFADTNLKPISMSSQRGLTEITVSTYVMAKTSLCTGDGLVQSICADAGASFSLGATIVLAVLGVHLKCEHSRLWIKYPGVHVPWPSSPKCRRTSPIFSLAPESDGSPLKLNPVLHRIWNNHPGFHGVPWPSLNRSGPRSFSVIRVALNCTVSHFF